MKILKEKPDVMSAKIDVETKDQDIQDKASVEAEYHLDDINDWLGWDI